ncbi:MAG: cyclase family protein [Chloroflexi bacterium]|nr:cyclase family protein [Chloroflexota bacterium]
MAQEITAELFYEYCKKFNNWGRWGEDDQLGCLNFITPEKIKRAAGLVRKGRVISCSIPVASTGPQFGLRGRINPLHLMIATGTDHQLDVQIKRPLGFGYADDAIYAPCQSGTQWDGFGHVFHHGKMWNGKEAKYVTTTGAQINGIEHFKDKIVSRGVLLDIPRLYGKEWLETGHAIMPDELDAAAAKQGVTIEEGDIVLLRTGDTGRCLKQGNWSGYAAGDAPGLSLLTAPWLHEKRIAGIASDTWGLEVRPNEIEDSYQPYHLILIPTMGLLVGEILDLEELAADCAADGTYEFLFVAPPLNITGGVGSPVNPLAIK